MEKKKEMIWSGLNILQFFPDDDRSSGNIFFYRRMYYFLSFSERKESKDNSSKEKVKQTFENRMFDIRTLVH